MSSRVSWWNLKVFSSNAKSASSGFSMSSQNPCLPVCRHSAIWSVTGSLRGPWVAIRYRIATPHPDPPPQGGRELSAPGAGRDQTTALFDLGAGARVLQLLEDAFRLFAIDALLDRLGRLVDQVL